MNGQDTGGGNAAGEGNAGSPLPEGAGANGGDSPQGGAGAAGGGNAGGDSLPSGDMEKGQAGGADAAQNDAGLDKKDQGEGKPAADPPDPADQPIGAGFKLDIENADPALAEAFTGIARDLGLTPKQAQGLARWQMDHVQAAREAMIRAGRDELAREWGGEADSRRNDALALVSRVDRELAKANPKLGAQSFSSAIAAFGADCSPAFVRGLAHIAALLSEDSIGAAGGASAGDVREESVLDGLRDAFKSARKKG